MPKNNQPSKGSYQNLTLKEKCIYSAPEPMMRNAAATLICFETQRPITLKEELRARYQLELACDGRVDLIVKLKDAPPDPIHLIAISNGVVL
jgi:hypothetical protein